MAQNSTFETISYRIRRDANGAAAWFARNWRGRKWFKWGVIALVLGAIVWLVAWALLARTLPDAETLLEYEPPLPTVVRGIDGDIVHSYARERRVQLQYPDFPQTLIEAYLAAEDKTFFSHGGIDAGGLFGAVIDYVSKLGSDERAVGGSTITQQVAKNILLTNEYSITRKIKEMMLARRIEGVLTKQQILELYLNEIPLGRRSYGVQAAARAYFDKDVGNLDLQEMAFLAILPKAPEIYGRAANVDRAIERRNFVLDQMAGNGFVSSSEAGRAKSAPLGLTPQSVEARSADAGYFLEETRRQLIDLFGETADDGKNSVYAGGLWVRTSLDTDMQDAARDALRGGMLRYQGSRGWNGPIATLDPTDGSLTAQLASSYLGINYKDWRIGVVLEGSGGTAQIGFADGDSASLSGAPAAAKVGDVIAVSPIGGGYKLQTVPEVSGGFVVENPQTGRVVAMQGGFDSRLGSFNRATQAERQPGSTIKPFIYAAGLDAGMTPSTMVADKVFCVYQGARLGEKCFRNFGGGGGGEHTMRWGLEQSRNNMTIQIANDTGMPKVVKAIENVGIGAYEPYLSMALGAGDTTVLKMVNAYSALANHGRQFEPSVIDYVQDRRGKIIWKADKRECEGCNMEQWNGAAMPRLAPAGKQVIDPRTAFQTVHMLEGVVQRGTAVRLRDLDLPLFGKTGTTSGPTNAWFVGGSPDYVVGMYLGFDQPRNMGGYVQGGNTAAPMMKQFVEATKAKWSTDPFVAPPGIRMVRVDRRSGKKVFGDFPTGEPLASVIWEAFKPDTEPPRITRRDEVDSRRREILSLIRQGTRARTALPRERRRVEEAPQDFVEEQGGLY